MSVTNYFADICRTIQAAAVESNLDPNFLARLIWEESCFDARAVSPAGAEGIAQFMPGTAELRGLGDAFNPAEALWAAAAYIADLTEVYGNIGLAAAAYNAGEARLERYLARTTGLPAETWNYVVTITGQPATVWRDAPPHSTVRVLDEEADSFHDACVAKAEGRTFEGFRQPLPSWGVIFTSNVSEQGMERQVRRLRNRYASLLRTERVEYTFGKTLGMRRAMHMAQVGRETRAEANQFCERLRSMGGACVVLRN